MSDWVQVLHCIIFWSFAIFFLRINVTLSLSYIAYTRYMKDDNFPQFTPEGVMLIAIASSL